jgi:LemA protein
MIGINLGTNLTSVSRNALARLGRFASFKPLVSWLSMAGLLLAAFASTGCGYNSVIDADEDVKAAWAQVQNDYQRRADLIPNLVKTVKGAADFEKDTLERVVQARAKVGQMTVDESIIDNPQKLKQFQEVQGELSGALSRLMVVAEQYPQLKATEAFRDLMVNLEGTENRITVARKRYIDTVAAYNKVVIKFPTSIGASMRSKTVRSTFEATTPGADKAPEVAF